MLGRLQKLALSGLGISARSAAAAAAWVGQLGSSNGGSLLDVVGVMAEREADEVPVLAFREVGGSHAGRLVVDLPAGITYCFQVRVASPYGKGASQLSTVHATSM